MFDPRNAVEHDYLPATSADAQRAVDIAELFVGATEAEYQRQSIVAVSWNMSGGSPEFPPFRDRPMLFIDVFEQPPAAKIVDPRAGEVRAATLTAFSVEQAIELATYLRKNYAEQGQHILGHGPVYFQQMKRRGGF